MLCETISLEYLKDDFPVGFVTGIKKEDQHAYGNRIGDNGTYLEFGESSELILTVRLKNGETHDIDVKNQLYVAFKRKRMSDLFERKLQDSMPKIVEIENGNQLSDNSIEGWLKSFKKVK